jgi:RimJ/RimL family protein N-acetyltransferase
MLHLVKRPRPSPAYQLRTQRLHLRCWDPADAASLTEAIAESLNELQVWMPWAKNEPEAMAAKAERLRGFRAQFDAGKDLTYGIFDHDAVTALGSIGMHDRIGAGAREIGYWIRTSHTRRGLATEAVAAVCRMGIEMLSLRRIEIHCHPLNLASAAIPRKLGFAHVATIPNCVPNEATGPRDSQIWAITRATYTASAASTANVQAFDMRGNAIELLART